MLVSISESPARHDRRSSRAADDRNVRAVALLDSARSAPPRERKRIQQRVVIDYLDVADAIAGRYRTQPEERGDLRQVAYLGLTKAVQRFEPSRGGDIVSFAVPTIEGEIKRYLRDSSWLVRPPRQLQELHLELRATVPRIAQRLGHEPSIAEIAEETGIAPARVAEALACGQGRHPASLDAPLRDGADEHETVTLGDTIRASGSDFARADLSAALHEACRTLTPREQRIIYLRFVHEQTQSQIARECGVTQMQISRLLAKILATLRERLGPEALAA